MIRLPNKMRHLLAIAAMLHGGSSAVSAEDRNVDPKLALSFVADHKAYKSGDVLTVFITETAVASTSARTRTDKSESASASLLRQDHGPQAWDAGLESSFDGGGQIERSGKLLAKLAVSVVSIDRDGNLSIQGEQEIVVNNERQKIRLQGIVRPEDVAPDNTVPSWRVSAAHIEFMGKGVLARRQSPGLFTRILSLFHLN